MSIVPMETIEVIAQGIGISNLSPDVALALAPDVEYRVREIMQEAIKCMHHSKRTILTADDVDGALSLRNVEPIYGFTSGDPLHFKRAVGHMDLFYIDDKDVIEAPLPKAPLEPAVVAHWLAIEGVQPAIPENAPVEALVAPLDTKKSEIKEEVLPVDIRLPVKHVLSRELQLYFDKITELTVNKSDSMLFKEALSSLATDSGLHPLVRYFTFFIADEPRVTRTLLHALLDPTKALTQHYGAIQGLAALGSSVVRLLILPNLEPYLKLLEPEMILEKQKNEMKRHEAWRVYGTLLCAAGQCMYERLKLFPGLLSPPARAVLRTNERVATTMPNGAMDAAMAGTKATADGFPTTSGSSILSSTALSRQVVNSSLPGANSRHRERSESRTPKMSAALSQAWKDDLNAWHLLASLFEHFGESILSSLPQLRCQFSCDLQDFHPF
ncbi:hypothetical protein Sjap_025127 [Stephania japonica]|uniref:TATA box binding protein associated factor (TAF) histone-like fold domain-containing protein n=1 Tax=Stephania japonica TaxID=461633 RepID=A0AAP0E1A6_9MAGN